VYLKSGREIYRLSIHDKKYELACWDGKWTGKEIKEDTAANLLKENQVTCSLQQVHFWILGMGDL